MRLNEQGLCTLREQKEHKGWLLCPNRQTFHRMTMNDIQTHFSEEMTKLKAKEEHISQQLIDIETALQSLSK